jgi:hypothetical protein
MRPAEITEPVILLNLNQLYRPGMSGPDLYDVTRGVWRVGTQRSRADFALAVANGKVVEIYQIHQWHPAATTPYLSGRQDQSDPRYAKRWEFTGVVAPSEVRDKYLGRSVKHYLLGAQNPIRYLNT